MSVPSIPKDQFLAIKQLWQTKLQTEEKIKSLEAICNINGNLKSILENLTKEFRAIPGSSISDTTGGSTVVDPATINHELLGGLLGGAANDHQHLTTAELAALHPAVTIADTTSVDLSLTGQQISAAVLPAGVDHNSLANLTTGDPHTQYTENSGSITQITTRNHNDLQNLNGGADCQHMTAAQIAALHAAVTVTDTASIDLSISGQTLSGAVLPAGVDHNSLNNLNAGATYQHITSTEKSGLHTRSHAIDSTGDHTSDITAGKILIANANKLPAGSAHIIETATGVGINVADPKTKLDVDGGIRIISGNVIGSSFDATLKRLRNTLKFYGTDGDMVFETFYPNTSSFRFFTGGRNAVGELYELLTLYKTNKVGIGAAIPVSSLEVQDGLTTTGSVLTLSTKEPTVVANDVLGAINFRAPLEADGGDAVLTGAAIVAIAEDTFSATVNKTSLQFKTGASEAATTKMTLSSVGNLDVTGTVKASAVQILADADTDDTADAFYFGAKDVDGSGRVRYNSTTQTFHFEKRASGSWVAA